jgi:hypothetical protein
MAEPQMSGGVVWGELLSGGVEGEAAFGPLPFCTHFIGICSGVAAAALTEREREAYGTRTRNHRAELQRRKSFALGPSQTRHFARHPHQFIGFRWLVQSGLSSTST